MAKIRKSRRAPARAAVTRAKAAKKVANKRVVALKQPEAVTPTQIAAPISNAPADRMPLFFWPYDVLRWWMPRDTARKGA